ncbi:hypothetical protein NMY22_g6075 [Coprinellus aureogranulatus]|nr:hypothetical protein NMY22_g6075 [Coprinellus aureogranulatus]
MVKLSILALIGFATTTLASLSSRAISAAPSGFDITNITFSESDCGSAIYRTSPSKDATVVFSALIASISDAEPNENHKNCVVSLAVSIPNGFNFGLKGLKTRTFYQLDAGTYALESATYSFGSASATSDVSLVGPTGPKDADHEYTFSAANGVRSPCGGNAVLTLALDLLVDVGSGSTGGTGVTSLDTFDLTQTNHFDWAAC